MGCPIFETVNKFYFLNKLHQRNTPFSKILYRHAKLKAEGSLTRRGKVGGGAFARVLIDTEQGNNNNRFDERGD
jgi:hypothetical protein